MNELEIEGQWGEPLIQNIIRDSFSVEILKINRVLYG